MHRYNVVAGLLFGLSFLFILVAEAQSGTACTVFVVGGAGRGTAPQLAQTLRAVELQAAALNGHSTLVLLDDRLGRTLLPAAGAPASSAQVALLAQLHGFPGRLVVVPGGLDDARDEQLARLLATPAGRPGAVMPEAPCPGPAELALDAQHTLVVLNTGWWLRQPESGTTPTTCEAQSSTEVLAQLNDVLRRNQGRHVLLVGQHPLARASWTLPLLPNPGYHQLRRSLRGTLEHYPGLVYISGQGRRHARYDEENALHYFISSTAAPVTKPTPAVAAPPATPVGDGFTRLEYAPNGQVKATYWRPDTEHPAGAMAAEQHWTDPSVAVNENPDTLQRAATPPATAVVRGSNRYQAGRFRIWLQGANYRREWQQPVRVPVLNLATAYGGLTPLKHGGGYQTKSLRLRAANGQEFVLRSIDKNTDASVPGFLHETFAAAIVQDQISAAHPYAALMVPPLAEAAGVGHTTPQLILVPDDPRLGIYRREFAGTLALLEARDPAPPRSFPGRPANRRYSTTEVLAQLQASARNRVDQRAVLRARLLDMVLADWDRHDDQWRWLAYPLPEGGKLFRPLPRDRDQALFVNEGVLPRQASVESLLPRLQGFSNGFRNVNSFNYQARYFDRSFLTGLSRTDWQTLADSVQASLTDAVLDQGLRQWPDSIYRLSGPIILAKLQAHRAQLPIWADQYYRFLAQAVDVVGSDEREEFEVMRQDNAHTQVTVYARPLAGSRGVVRYQRTFSTEETAEIRLYGQGGADVFVLNGLVAHGPTVRVVGGEGVDTLRDASAVSAGRHTVVAYDTPTGLVAAAHGSDTKLHLAAQPDINAYNRTAFQYPYAGPLYPWSYNVDDGLFVGVGLLLKRPGFRKSPWAATHQFTGNVALRTGAFNFAYDGLLTHAVGSFDLQLRAAVQAPNYVRSFYGLGNDTHLVPDQPTSAPYYRVRFRNLTAAALLRHTIGRRGVAFGGPIYQGVDVENSPGRILDQSIDARLRPATLLAVKQYLGARLGYELRGLHTQAELPQGIHWQTELLALRPLTATAQPLTQLTSNLTLYRSFRFPLRLTLATRFGGTVNFGDYEFFQAATLGGLTNLRGYGRTRFAGSQSAYNNTELRLQLARFRSYFLPATLGLLAFHDVGRVWVPGEHSNSWHRGYGPGLWLAPTPQVVIAAMYGISEEDRLPLVRLGFLF
ncbi:hypothetical protein [Hymenobacter negativus]|uniref:Bacterial surface antigen (D15) domain-containing protein n=1 Tax=Hymenobacter negativus TaxID=2795026 RepID=A0ABS3QGQ0_9BACT|nr:hypothetical protein [Hymenobacter negativus]MBO2009969.1 hypothetical protein [Hymenobacter negativus]